jgi:hypothetical protein
LTQWLADNFIPSIFELNEDYKHVIFGEGKQVMILFTDSTKTRVFKTYRKAAKELRGKFMFSYSGFNLGL